MAPICVRWCVAVPPSVPTSRSCVAPPWGAMLLLQRVPFVCGDVPDYALMAGVPAMQKDWMSRHGHRLPAPDADGLGGLPGKRLALPGSRIWCHALSGLAKRSGVDHLRGSFCHQHFFTAAHIVSFSTAARNQGVMYMPQQPMVQQNFGWSRLLPWIPITI